MKSKIRPANGTAIELANARSATRGRVNVGLIAPTGPLRAPARGRHDERVKAHFGPARGEVERFELENISALNFLSTARSSAAAGLAQADAQGKTYAAHRSDGDRGAGRGPSPERARSCGDRVARIVACADRGLALRLAWPPSTLVASRDLTAPTCAPHRGRLDRRARQRSRRRDQANGWIGRAPAALDALAQIPRRRCVYDSAPPYQRLAPPRVERRPAHRPARQVAAISPLDHVTSPTGAHRKG